jgi:hypothetical protein
MTKSTNGPAKSKAEPRGRRLADAAGRAEKSLKAPIQGKIAIRAEAIRRINRKLQENGQPPWTDKTAEDVACGLDFREGREAQKQVWAILDALVGALLAAAEIVQEAGARPALTVGRDCFATVQLRSFVREMSEGQRSWLIHQTKQRASPKYRKTEVWHLHETDRQRLARWWATQASSWRPGEPGSEEMALVSIALDVDGERISEGETFADRLGRETDAFKKLKRAQRRERGRVT